MAETTEEAAARAARLRAQIDRLKEGDPPKEDPPTPGGSANPRRFIAERMAELDAESERD